MPPWLHTWKRRGGGGKRAGKDGDSDLSIDRTNTRAKREKKLGMRCSTWSRCNFLGVGCHWGVGAKIQFWRERYLFSPSFPSFERGGGNIHYLGGAAAPLALVSFGGCHFKGGKIQFLRGSSFSPSFPSFLGGGARSMI